MEQIVDVTRFVALSGSAFAGGLVVREVLAGRDRVVAALLAAFALCAAPVVVQAAQARAFTWQLVSVTAGVVLAVAALGRARWRPAQVLRRVPAVHVPQKAGRPEPVRAGIR